MAPNTSLLASSSRSANGRSLVPRVFMEQEAGFSPSPDHVSRLHTLNARPFDHLGLWAYLAFAFVCLAMLTVFSYMIYTCYHSSKGIMTAKNLNIGNTESSTKLEDDGALKIMPANHTGRRTKKGLKVGERVGAVGEKMRAKVGKTFLEMKGFKSGSNNHRRKQSESEQNIMHSRNASETSISYTNESTYDLDNYYLTSPVIAHTSDRAATYIPFHLPPPPPSPTLAHKEYIGRQYRGRAQLSPVSPSPSFSPVPVFPQVPPGIGPSDANTLDEGRARLPSVIENDNAHDERIPTERPEADVESQDESPAPEFDSHNIRFVPPLNPFMTPSTSTVMIWNDPKLSPINGSIVTSNNINMLSSTPRDAETSFQGIINAALKNVTESPKKLIKDILPRAVTRRHAEEEQENGNPFEQVC